MLQLKREISLDQSVSSFTSKILAEGYFLKVQVDPGTLILKRKRSSDDNLFEKLYGRVNPFNSLHVHFQSDCVTIKVKLIKILATLITLNLIFSFLLVMAGLPLVGIISLPAVFFLLQLLIVLLYCNFKMFEIVTRTTAADLDEVNS